MLEHDFAGQYGKGYHPPTHDVSQDFSARGLLGAPLRLAQEFSLEQYIQQVWDQGQTSSCVGWSFAQAVKLRLAVMGSLITLPSPEAIYVCSRAMEREQAGLSPDDHPLQDNGTQSLLAIQAMQRWGIPSNDAWPFDPATINNEPTLEELEVASQFQLAPQGYARILSVGQQRLVDIKQAISAGYPVQIGTSVDKAFEDYDGTGVITAPVVANILGGHAMHIVGYRSDGAFRGVNQWGTSWGDRGLYWADPMFVMSDYLDAIVLMVGATGKSGSMIRKVA